MLKKSLQVHFLKDSLFLLYFTCVQVEEGRADVAVDAPLIYRGPDADPSHGNLSFSTIMYPVSGVFVTQRAKELLPMYTINIGLISCSAFLLTFAATASCDPSGLQCGSAQWQLCSAQLCFSLSTQAHNNM